MFPRNWDQDGRYQLIEDFGMSLETVWYHEFGNIKRDLYCVIHGENF